MAIKKRPNKIDKTDIDNLANELADKPYGQRYDTIVRTSISLPSSVLFKLEDLALTNKRKGENLRSVSAIIRDCIAKSLSI